METLIADDGGDEFWRQSENLPPIPRVQGATIWRCWWEIDGETHRCLVSKQAVKAWTDALKIAGATEVRYAS